MRTIRLLLSIIISFVSAANAQTNDSGLENNTNSLNCISNTFYGLTSTNDVVSLTLSGNTVINNGVIATYSNNINSLAIGNDLINGTNQHVLYTSNVDSILFYDGSNWNPILYDPVTYHNAGGANAFIYYMAYSFPAMISRFTGNSLIPILIDSNLTFTVADIAVTDSGSVFYFAGTGANTQYMYEISSSGNLLNTYPLSLYTAGGYGCFVINNIIYVGLGPAGSPANSLIPITINGTTATAGAAISMPALNIKDLAGCFGEVTDGTSMIKSEESIQIFPNPVNDVIKFNTDYSGSFKLEIFNTTGSLMVEKDVLHTNEEISVSQLPTGIYFARLKINNKVVYKTINKL